MIHAGKIRCDHFSMLLSSKAKATAKTAINGVTQTALQAHEGAKAVIAVGKTYVPVHILKTL